MNKGQLKIAGFAVLIAAAAASWAPWTFSAPAMRASLASETQRLTGLVLGEGGRYAIALLPRPHVKIEGARLSDASGAFTAEIPTMKVDLRLSSLIAGRLDPAGASLYSPVFRFDLDRPLAMGGQIAALFDGKRRNDLGLGVLWVMGGEAVIARPSRDEEHRIENIDASFDWRRALSSAALNGAATWRGERADVSLWIDRPVDVFAGPASAASLRIVGPSLDLSWDGRVAMDTQLTMSGRAVASSPSLRRLMRVAGTDMALPGPLGKTALRSDMSYGAKGLSLPGLSLSLDGNAWEGSLNLRVDEGRPTLSGTLATKQLLADSWIDASAQWRASDGAWSRDPFDWRQEQEADLDLRVSASRVRLAGLQFDDTAFAVLLKNGRMEVTLAEAQGYKGVLKGRATITPAPGGLETRGSLTATRVDAAGLFGKALGVTRISGLATAQFSFEAMGGNVAQMMRTLEGRGQANLRGGEISGLDLEQALRRIDKRPLAIPLEVRNGRTTFETASAAVKVTGGQAEIGPGLVSGPGVQIAFAGAANVAERTVAIRADAQQTGAEKKPDAPRLPLEFSGSWDEPRLVADMQALLRRSGAAAPLLTTP